MAPLWVTLVVSALTDFIISGGGALSAAFSASGAAFPSKTVMAIAGLTGLIAAARRIQALLQVPPPPPGVQGKP